MEHQAGTRTMAKGNMLLGFARGKVGDLVFTRRNGQQVTRPRVRVISNPKTEGQQIQRMIFATVAAAYARLKTICDHSIEGLKYGADTQAKFMSDNLKRLRAYYAAYPDAAALAELQPYEGMAFALPNDRANAGVGLIIAQGTIAAPEPVVSDAGLLQGFGAGVSQTPTIAEVLSALGAVAGDQITVIALSDNGEVKKSRYVVDVNATDEQLSGGWTSDGSAAAFDADRTIVDTVVLAKGNVLAMAVVAPNFDMVGAAIIISRRDSSGKWLRSNAILYSTLDEAPRYQGDYALPYWQFEGTDIVTDSPYYLNNADE